MRRWEAEQEGRRQVSQSVNRREAKGRGQKESSEFMGFLHEKLNFLEFWVLLNRWTVCEFRRARDAHPIGTQKCASVLLAILYPHSAMPNSELML